jgi:hypothetical protein
MFYKVLSELPIVLAAAGIFLPIAVSGMHYHHGEVVEGEVKTVRLQAGATLNKDKHLCYGKQLIVEAAKQSEGRHLYSIKGEFKVAPIKYTRVLDYLGDNQYKLSVSASLDGTDGVMGIEGMTDAEIESVIKRQLFVPIDYHCVSKA